MASPISVDHLDAVQKLAQSFYDEAWGNTWDHEPKTLLRSELDIGWDLDGASAVLADEFGYNCIQGVARVVSALQVQSPLSDNVIIRKEYELLFESLTTGRLRDETQSVVVTGHPGIGKTTFLLLLLLLRLSEKRPTALQLNTDWYFIFNDDGVVVRPLGFVDVDLRKCWALVDSNGGITMPDSALSKNAIRVIHTASLRLRRWKKWSTQHDANTYFMDLPHGMEIAAIVKEHGFDPFSALSHVNKWGPSVRTILYIMAAVTVDKRALAEVEQELECSVTAVAARICEAPSSFRVLVLEGEACEVAQPSLGSDLLFIVPCREHRPDGSIVIYRTVCMSMVPTEHLSGIFFAHWTQMDHDKALELYGHLSSHSPSKPSTGCMHKMRVHAFLSDVNIPLCIFRGRTRSKMLPLRTRVVPSAISSLKDTKLGALFYCYLSRTDFPYIDGLLGSRKAGRKAIYAVHTTMTRPHGSPVDGLKHLFPLIEHLIPDSHVLNFVVVADDEACARHSMTMFSEALENLVLTTGKGRHVRVVVWGCVLPRNSF
ncbi:hypothetical protein PENSPDRAFT_660115 [Peniophora sp. CONT]|nr:hypothetical protein PENSPDRAFT_660115 [Peniophora sp. CONT]